MKRALAFLIAVILAVSNIGIAFADIGMEPDLTVKVFVGDDEVYFPDVQPFISDSGRVMIPIRFVNQCLGATVYWNHDETTATIDRVAYPGQPTEQRVLVSMTIGDNFYRANGNSYTVDTPVQAVPGDRIVLPGAYIAQPYKDVYYIAKLNGNVLEAHYYLNSLPSNIDLNDNYESNLEHILINGKNNLTFNVTSNGEPLQNATISLDGVSLRTTSWYGEATLSNISNGIYNWEVGLNGYEPQSGTMTLNSDQTVNVDLIKKPDIRSIILGVFDNIPYNDGSGQMASGKAVEGATVKVNGETFITNNSGQVNLTSLPDGEYICTITKDGFYPKTEPIKIASVVPWFNQHINVTINTMPRVIFNVTSNGTAIQNANVNVDFKSYTTDISGNAVTIGLINNNYTYTISKTGYVTKTGTFAMNGSDMTINVSLEEALTFTLNIASNPIGGGIITGGGTYNQGDTAIINVTSNAGYRFVKIDIDGTEYFTSIMTVLMDENKTITVYFEPIPILGTVTVNYIDATTGERFRNSDIIPNRPIGIFTFTAGKEISGYELIGNATRTVNITPDNLNITLDYLYNKKEVPVTKGTIKINYTDESGKQLLPSETNEYEAGTYTFKNKTIDSYIVLEPSTQEITIAAGENKTITFVYKAIKGELKVSFKDDMTGNKVTDDVTITDIPMGKFQYTVSKVIDGFTLVGDTVRNIVFTAADHIKSIDILYKKNEVTVEPNPPSKPPVEVPVAPTPEPSKPSQQTNPTTPETNEPNKPVITPSEPETTITPEPEKPDEPVVTPSEPVKPEPPVTPVKSEETKPIKPDVTPEPTKTVKNKVESVPEHVQPEPILEDSEKEKVQSEPELSGTITGRIIFENGKPLANARIELHSDPISTYTDKDGYYIFKDVPLGTHKIYLADERYSKELIELQEIQVNIGKEKSIINNSKIHSMINVEKKIEAGEVEISKQNLEQNVTLVLKGFKPKTKLPIVPIAVVSVTCIIVTSTLCILRKNLYVYALIDNRLLSKKKIKAAKTTFIQLNKEIDLVGKDNIRLLFNKGITRKLIGKEITIINGKEIVVKITVPYELSDTLNIDLRNHNL